ncbi:MAG: pentapeptide repeat-containing protein, partial [Deltaproteobacteria bacterium]|nr:pentapeptide repeat-containing protein [Deltaproteobacteria bacterium]
MTSDAPREPKPAYAKAKIDGESFAGRDLRGADFRKARLANVDFTGAELSGADFSGAKLAGARLVNVRAEGAVFKSASFERCELRGASLVDCDFTRASIREGEWVDVEERGGRFTETAFAGVTFRGGRFAESQWLESNWSKCRVERVRFEGVRMEAWRAPSLAVSGATFADCSILYADLLSAKFEAVSFVGCSVTETDLAGSKWSGARIERCDLTKTEFTTGEFRDCAIADCVVRKSNFRYASGLDEATMARLAEGGARVSRYMLHRVGRWLTGTRPGRVALAATIGAAVGSAAWIHFDPRWWGTEKLYREIDRAGAREQTDRVVRLTEHLVVRLAEEAERIPETRIGLARAYQRIGKTKEAVEVLSTLLSNEKTESNLLLEAVTFMAQIECDAARFDGLEDMMRRVFATKAEPEMKRHSAVTILYAVMPTGRRDIADRLFDLALANLADQPEAVAELSVMRAQSRLDEPGRVPEAAEVDRLLGMVASMGPGERTNLVRILIRAGRFDEAATQIAALLARNDLQPRERGDAMSQRAQLEIARGNDEAFLAAIAQVMDATVEDDAKLNAVQESVGLLAERQRFETLSRVVDLARERMAKDRQSVKDLRLLRINTLNGTPLKETALADLRDLSTKPAELREVEKLQLAAVYANLGDDDGARRMLAAMGDEAQLPVYQRHERIGLETQIDLRAGKKDGLEAAIARLLVLPGGSEPKLNMAREIMGTLGARQDFDAIDRVAKAVLAKFGGEPRVDYEIRYARAQAFIYGPRGEDAIADFEYLLKIPPANPGKRLTLLEGVLAAYRNAGRADDAARTIETIAREYPEQKEFLLSAKIEDAQALRNRGDKTGAEKKLLEALGEVATPDARSRVLNALAALYLEMNRFDAAAARLDESLAVATPYSEGWLEAQAHRAGMRQQRGENAKALEELDAVLAKPMPPSYEEWLRGTRVNVLAALGRLGEAIDECRRVIAITPDATSKAYHRLNLAQYQWQSGAKDEANRAWEELAGSSYPPDVRQSAWERMAQARMDAKDGPGAIA